MDVYVEGVHIHHSLGALTVWGDAWVVCSHQELPSRNLHHLHGTSTCFYLHMQTNCAINWNVDSGLITLMSYKIITTNKEHNKTMKIYNISSKNLTYYPPINNRNNSRNKKYDTRVPQMCSLKRVTYRKQRLGCQTSCFCIQVIFTAHGIMVYLNTQLKLAHMWTQFCNPWFWC